MNFCCVLLPDDIAVPSRLLVGALAYMTWILLLGWSLTQLGWS